MDGFAEQGEKQRRERAARDSDQRRNEPDDVADAGQGRSRWKPVAESPGGPAEQMLQPDRIAEYNKYDFEQRRRRKIRDDTARHDPEHDRNCPDPQNMGENRRSRTVGEKRADGDRNDDRKRRADAELHAHVFGNAQKAKKLVENGNGDSRTADPEKTREQAGKNSGNNNYYFLLEF